MIKIQIVLNFGFGICLRFVTWDLELPDAKHRKGRPYTEGTAAFLPSSLTMNHSFPLGYSPYPPVSVSGTEAAHNTTGFSRRALQRSSPGKCRTFPRPRNALRRCLGYGCQTNKALRSVSLVPCLNLRGRDGILTVCPSAAAFAIALGPPNPWLIASATETLDFRGSNFSLGLWLLMPTFSLRTAPPRLTAGASVQYECSPTARCEAALKRKK
jgi:hypothetical protein